MSDLAIEPNSLWERCLLDDIQNRSNRRVMRLEWWIMRSTMAVVATGYVRVTLRLVTGPVMARFTLEIS